MLTRRLILVPQWNDSKVRIDMIAIAEQLYRSVVDDQFRARLMVDPELFGLEGMKLPEAVEPEVQHDLAGASMADVDVQAGDITCSWAVTVRCDRFDR